MSTETVKVHSELPAHAKLSVLPTDVISRDDTRYAFVYVEDWDPGRSDAALKGQEGWFRIRSITSKQRAEIEKRVTQKKRDGTKEMIGDLLREWFIVYGVVDEQGRPIFASEHVQALTGKNTRPLSTLSEAITALSGISDKDLEELVGESTGSPSGD